MAGLFRSEFVFLPEIADQSSDFQPSSKVLKLIRPRVQPENVSRKQIAAERGKDSIRGRIRYEIA